MIVLICMIITLTACGNDAGGGAQTTDHSSNQEPSQSEDVTVNEQAQTFAPEDTGSSREDHYPLRNPSRQQIWLYDH